MNMNDVFFNSLYESLAKEDTEEDDDKVCLISQEPLKDGFIKLYCGHRFNYKNLYDEVVMQKLKPAYTEVQRLKTPCIKCPYCRKVQVGLLPQYDGYEIIRGVNKPKKYIMKVNNCDYVFLSGKRKGERCDVACEKKYCKRCDTVMKRRERKMVDKNIVVSNKKKGNTNKGNTKEGNDICNAILASGKNQGKRCKCKAKKNGMCGRHANVKNNKK